MINPHRALDALVATHGSQIAAAKKLKLSPSYFSDLRHGRRTISDRVLKKLGLCRVVVARDK